MPRMSSTAAHDAAGEDLQNLLGRAPTESEIAMAVPQYQGDWNGSENGRAYVAQYATQLQNQTENSPWALQQKQQQQWQAAAPKSYDAVRQTVKSLLGRDATQDELQHYGTLISSGQADPYSIRQFIQATPEYQNTQDTQFRQGLNTELQGYDTQFFNRSKGDIVSQYARMGRQTSPALDVALTDLSAQINERRGQYLAQVGASQYGGNKQAAVQDYQAQQNQNYNQTNQNISGLYNNYQTGQARLNNISDYNTQQRDWYNQMGQYQPKGPGALDYLNTAFNGINAGAKVYSGGMK